MSTLQERLRDGEMSPALWDKAADRLDALEREVEALRVERDLNDSQCDAYRVDACRYRWLRTAIAWKSEDGLDGITPEEYDTKLDACMAHMEQQGARHDSS